MRHRTRALHSQAERSGVVAALLRGDASQASYARYLRALLPGYQIMELALQADSRPAVVGLGHEALYRAEAIEADLRILAGGSWPETLPLLESGRRYAERVEAAAAGDGALLLAHFYTRYLGDLSGGQIIGRRLEKLFGDSALAFTAFPAIDDISRFAANFRAALDRAGRHVANPSRVLDEVQVAFRMNIDISIEALTTAG